MRIVVEHKGLERYGMIGLLRETWAYCCRRNWSDGFSSSGIHTRDS